MEKKLSYSGDIDTEGILTLIKKYRSVIDPSEAQALHCTNVVENAIEIGDARPIASGHIELLALCAPW